jgi:hypothetical protein
MTEEMRGLLQCQCFAGRFDDAENEQKMGLTCDQMHHEEKKEKEKKSGTHWIVI